MKRVYRLRKPAQFLRVRREGRRVEEPLFTLQAVANRRPTTRCGFVVSKKIGIAVIRNRAKRRMREVIRLTYMHIAPGWDLVFIIRSSAVAEVEFQHLSTRVQQALQKARVLRETSTS